MFSIANLVEASCYEALCLLTADGDQAWSLMRSLRINDESPLPSYSLQLGELLNASKEDIESAWQKVRMAFERERLDYSILKHDDPLFPVNVGTQNVHYLYLAGNAELLKEERITFLGMPHPSIQGKSDILEAVSEAVKRGIAIMAPLDTGLGAFALSVALKENGKAIALLSGGLSKCPSEGLMQLQMDLYQRGLLLSIFAPSVKIEKYHVVFRNRYLSGISKAIYLAEEKDGGPAWAIFDPALSYGIPTMISSSLVENPNYTWARSRVERGALVAKKGSDIKKLIIKKGKRKREEIVDLTPDLFDGI